jgi:hypothetical protein
MMIVSAWKNGVFLELPFALVSGKKRLCDILLRAMSADIDICPTYPSKEPIPHFHKVENADDGRGDEPTFGRQKRRPLSVASPSERPLCNS